jgi:catechol-2,3-dioxygenase
MKFSIEHIGICVSNPIEMAKWYKKVLGFEIKFCGEDSEKAVAFVTDADNKIMLEFGKIPNVKTTKESLNHHLQFHIALKSENPDDDAKFLVQNGATFIEKCPITRVDDYLIVLEDPWGNCIQLSKRGNKIMK